MNHSRIQITFIFILFTLYPTIAYAYVDPGIISVLIQVIFASIAGVTTAWLVTPWSTIKSFFKKHRTKNTPSEKKDNFSPNSGNITDDGHK